MARVDQNGSYKARWDITYGITTSPDQINEAERNCGPEPLSTQTFTLEHDFEVRLSENGSAVIVYSYERRTLGSQPTGDVSPRKNGGMSSGAAGIKEVCLFMILAMTSMGGLLASVA
ncbi:hypothetical protein V5O48_001443 [Marasmius crinis-equi]|uniref:Uncharacterized protein n=1 Tax=Marasmius crinis-equi TaxID=585013 RepID=A0ABR3FYE1_9AGAR